MKLFNFLFISIALSQIGLAQDKPSKISNSNPCATTIKSAEKFCLDGRSATDVDFNTSTKALFPLADAYTSGDLNASCDIIGNTKHLTKTIDNFLFLRDCKEAIEACRSYCGSMIGFYNPTKQDEIDSFILNVGKCEELLEFEWKLENLKSIVNTDSMEILNSCKMRY